MGVGEHPLVSRMLKGAFNSRPPLPKYKATWKVSTVIEFITNLGINKDLTIANLTLKTAMLMASTRPSRSADLANLDLDRRSYTPEGVNFLPNTLAKQSKRSKPIQGFFFPSFSANELICLVKALREYEVRTAPIRGKETSVFLAMINPHKPVTSSTIARWLKKVLELSGVDTFVFWHTQFEVLRFQRPLPRG